MAYRVPEGVAGPRMHCTISWGASVLLSVHGSEEFAEGLNTALGIARQIREDGEYRP